MKQHCPNDEGCEKCGRLHDDCDGTEEQQEKEMMEDERKAMDVDDSHYAEEE